MEALLPSTTTTSNAIEFTRENAFTNNAAEAAEGAQKAGVVADVDAGEHAGIDRCPLDQDFQTIGR